MNYANQKMDGSMVSSMPSDNSHETNMLSYRLPCPGARPLQFKGTELAMAMSFTPELPYWYEINIYRTSEHHFVLAIRLFFQSEDESDSVKCWIFETLAETFEAIESYDAAADVKVDFVNLPGETPAELAAWSIQVRAKIAAFRANFASLAGELFEEMYKTGAYNE